jgi:hypothetical protein
VETEQFLLVHPACSSSPLELTVSSPIRRRRLFIRPYSHRAACMDGRVVPSCYPAPAPVMHHLNHHLCSPRTSRRQAPSPASSALASNPPSRTPHTRVHPCRPLRAYLHVSVAQRILPKLLHP